MNPTDPRTCSSSTTDTSATADPFGATDPCGTADPSGTAAPSGTTAPSGTADPGRTARLEDVLRRLVARRGITHAVAGVATADGSFRWQGAAGIARPDGTPMRTATPYFIASVTKLYIATTILQLAEQGQLDLDASITTYLPPAVTSGLHRLDGVDRTAEITIRHLLSHTSGLPDFLEDRPRGGRSWYQELIGGQDRGWTFEDVVARTRDDLSPRFAPQDLSAERQKARYSDTGFQLLIAIIEAVTDQDVAKVFEQRFSRRLGLRHTYLPGRSQPLDPAPLPAMVYDRGRPLDAPRTLGSCLDLVSTVDDTERFMRALVRGDLFEDAATYRLMHERWNRIYYPMRYGLATMRFPVNRLVGPGQRPVTLLGHSGSTGSWLFHCPELDVLLTGTVDQIRGRTIPFRLMARLLQAYHG